MGAVGCGLQPSPASAAHEILYPVSKKSTVRLECMICAADWNAKDRLGLVSKVTVEGLHVGTIPHGYAKSVPLLHKRPNRTPEPKMYVQAQSNQLIAAGPQQHPRAPQNQNLSTVDS